ncbi:MAG: type II secretion system F family protein [Verrucomicrobia bacterium]|nr:type II secretion system F family protein [Verrucomicrobiota bacterium]
MPKFSYTAMDARGNETSGEIEVESSAAAITKIKEMGYYPTKVVEAGARGRKGVPMGAAGGAKPAKKGLSMEINIPGLTGRVNKKLLTVFTRQLATLIDAGLPLLRGLRTLERQERNSTLKKTVSALAEAVEGGSTLSEAMQQHPRVFDRLYVNMIRAGEAGGVMEVVLTRLAEFSEKAQKIRGKVISASVYPVIVLLIAVTILFFLMTFIVPKFQEIFRDLLEGKPLPVLTQYVMEASKLIRENVLMVVGSVVGVVVAFKLIIAKIPLARRLWDGFKLNAPVFGPLIRRVNISRFTRTLGTLISSGVPILQALMIVKDTTANAVIANALQSVHDSVKEGESVVRPLEASKVCPPMVVSMVDVGEETGALPEMLMKVADNYDDEVDNAVAGLTSLLEPLLIVFLALVVGTIVIALFMPLVSILQTLGQQQ